MFGFSSRIKCPPEVPHIIAAEQGHELDHHIHQDLEVMFYPIDCSNIDH